MYDLLIFYINLSKNMTTLNYKSIADKIKFEGRRRKDKQLNAKMKDKLLSLKDEG